MMITKDVYLEYENSAGMSLGLAPFMDFFLTECNESLSNDIISEKLPYLDGEVPISMTLGTRNIEIVGHYNSYYKQELMTRNLQKVFNVNLDGTLTYKNRQRGTEYEIDCKVLEVPEPKLEPSEGRTVFVIQLEANDPLWKGQGETENISKVKKCGRFPLIIPKEKFIFGYRMKTMQSTFENLGDAEASVYFKVTAKNGPVVRPSITLEGDEPKTLLFDRTLEKGEYVEFIHTPSTVSCILNGKENAIGYLDQDNREWFYLNVGKNTISYNADEGALNLEVIANYTPLYLGVY